MSIMTREWISHYTNGVGVRSELYRRVCIRIRVREGVQSQSWQPVRFRSRSGGKDRRAYNIKITLVRCGHNNGWEREDGLRR